LAQASPLDLPRLAPVRSAMGETTVKQRGKGEADKPQEVPKAKFVKPLILRVAPAEFEYGVSRIIVPYLRAIGMTPNAVTLMNTIPRVLCLYWTLTGQTKTAALMVVFSQVFDAADGTMARMYNMGSPFGQWLDITSDNIFGVVFYLMVNLTWQYELRRICVSFSMGAFTAYFGNVAENNTKKLEEWDTFTLAEKTGKVVQDYMMCILGFACLSPLWLGFYFPLQ